MKFLCSFMLMMLCMGLQQCFSQYFLKGNIRDQQQKPLAFANINLHSIDSAVMQTVFTDSSGNFGISILDSVKALYAEATTLGFNTEYYTIHFSRGVDTLIWNPVLVTKENILGNVTINSKAALIERKLDRTVFNVANSAASNGSDAFELLKKTPGVQISKGNINITGKSSVSVMINDKLMEVDATELESLLRSMPSNEVSRIEVITAPPAKYDAQGNSGIINIVTKKNRRNGLNGTLTAGYEQREKASEDVSGTFNYRNNNLNVYGNTSVSNQRYISRQQTNTFYPDQQQQQFLYQDNRPRYSYSQLGVDYNLSSNAVLGLLYTHGTLDGKRDEDYHTDVLRVPDLLRDSVMLTDAYATDRARRNVFNLNYEWKIDSAGQKLTANIDYFLRKANKNRNFTTSDFCDDGSSTGAMSDNRTYGLLKTDVTTAKLDYELPTKFAVLSFGARASFIHNNSDIIFKQLAGGDYIIDTGKSNTFDYKENTQALYASAQKAVGKWNMQLGLRGEYTQTNGYSLNLATVNKNNYFKLFPTAYLQYKPNETHSFNINYSRRIDRPSFWIMNPFRVYLTETSYEEGNPFLQPAFSNNIELGYAYKSVFAMTLFTQRVTRLITRVSHIDTINNSFNFGQANAGTSDQYGITTTLNFKPIKCWETTTQFLGFYNRFKTVADNTAISYGKPSFSVVSNNTFTLNASETLMAELDFTYTSAQQSDYDIQRYFYLLGGGIKALFAQKKLILTLDVEDVFKTDIWQVTNLYNGTYQNGYFDGRLVRVALTWKFGNKNIQAKRDRTVNTEEAKRAN